MTDPPNAIRVCVVDDDEDMRDSLLVFLERSGCIVSGHESGEQALAALAHSEPDVIVTDLRMPGMSGIDLLEQIQTVNPRLPVVLISAHGDVPMAVEAMSKGAYSFLEKPFQPGRLLTVIQHSAEAIRLQRANRRLRDRLSDISSLDRVLIGQTELMVALREEILDASDLNLPVLITGETGTGKEIVARALHDLGPRADGPFVAVSCGAIPDALFEVQMFGQAPGALTGQDYPVQGHLQKAECGTLFLDEVSALPPAQQVKLQRVLEHGEMFAVGSAVATTVDVRVISSTSEDPGSGRVGQGLLQRINALALMLPPLRNRQDDIALLYSHFLDRFARVYEIEPPDVSTKDMASLLAHGWFGNVRELRNVAERRVLAARRGEGSAAEAIAPLQGRAEPIPPTLREAVAAFERQLIGQALRTCNGTMDDVAEALGIGRRTLNEKMQKLGIDKTEL